MEAYRFVFYRDQRSLEQPCSKHWLENGSKSPTNEMLARPRFGWSTQSWRRKNMPKFGFILCLGDSVSLSSSISVVWCPSRMTTFHPTGFHPTSRKWRPWIRIDKNLRFELGITCKELVVFCTVTIIQENNMAVLLCRC